MKFVLLSFHEFILQIRSQLFLDIKRIYSSIQNLYNDNNNDSVNGNLLTIGCRCNDENTNVNQFGRNILNRGYYRR